MDEGGGLSLPNEVVVLIFEFLSATDLATCATVSLQWRALADTNALWLHHYLHYLTSGDATFAPIRWDVSPSFLPPSSDPKSWRSTDYDWKHALRGARITKQNWQRGRPTHRETFVCSSRASGLCFDHRFLYVGLNRGSVQVFHLHGDSAMEVCGDVAEKEDEDADTDQATDASPLIFFPSPSSSAPSSPVSSSPPSPSSPSSTTKKDKWRREVMKRDRMRSSALMLHSPHSSYSDVMALHRQRLFAASGRSITVWNVEVEQASEIQRVEVTYDGHTNKISCLGFTDHHMISGSWDRTVRVWDLNTGQCLHTMTGHSANIKHLQAVDTTRVVSSSNDNALVEWDMRTYAKARSTQCLNDGHRRGAPAVSAFHYDPDRNLIVVGQRDGTVQRLCYSDIFAGSSFMMGMPGSVVMRHHKGLIHKIQMDAYKVLSSSQDGVVAVWDLATGSMLYHLRAGNRGTLNAMQLGHSQLYYANDSNVECLSFSPTAGDMS